MTTPEVLDVVARVAARGQRGGVRRDRRRARSASAATRSASSRAASTALGLVGDPEPSAPPALVEALAAGRVPVVVPLADGPLNVNADEAAAALALGLGAERIVFVSDVPGVLVDGSVATRPPGRRRRGRASSDGRFEGGIVPKLMAAVRAARGGVRASIGATEVPA